MKVAILESSGRDFFRSRLRFCKFLIKQGIEVTAIVPDDGFVHKLLNSGLKVIKMRESIRSRGIKTKYLLFIDLCKIFANNNFDIIHLFKLQPGLIGTIAVKLFSKSVIIFHICGLGYIFTKKSLKFRSLQFFVKFSLNIYQRLLGVVIICQNNDDIKDLSLKKSTYCIKGSSVDESRFYPRKTKSNNKGIYFLFASRIIEDKGIFELIHGFRMAAEMAPKKINLIIAGWFDKDSQYTSSRIELEKIILNDNRIKFVGKSDEMEKLISEIHIGILPTYYREGTPRFLLECMAMKKTIITTSVPGCSHLFLKNTCIGIKIDPRSPVAIRDAILEVLKKDLIATGKNSRKVYQNHFSEKVVFNQIIKVYQNRYRASSFLNE